MIYVLNWEEINRSDSRGWFLCHFEQNEYVEFMINEKHSSEWDYYIDIRERKSVLASEPCGFIGKSYFKPSDKYVGFFNAL